MSLPVSTEESASVLVACHPAPTRLLRISLDLWRRTEGGPFEAEHLPHRAMAKPRRNVQFQHRGSNHQNGRRPSISESEGVSEPGSPTRASMNGRLESSKEEVTVSAQMRYFHRDGLIFSINADG